MTERKRQYRKRNEEITDKFESGMSAIELGKLYGVSRSRIYEIIKAHRRIRAKQADTAQITSVRSVSA